MFFSYLLNCAHNNSGFKVTDHMKNEFQIVLHLKPPLEEEEIEGSADWISEESSGHGSNDNDDSTMLDDEDFTRSKTNSVYVVCDETVSLCLSEVRQGSYRVVITLKLLELYKKIFNVLKMLDKFSNKYLRL